MKKILKWGVIGLIVIMVIGAMSGGDKSTSETSDTNTTEQQATQQEQVVEKVNVEVASQIVKKVNGKYRYFFDIRNNDVKDFEGSVTISLFNSQYKSALGKDTFSTNQPIKPGLGNSVYVEANSGTTSQIGENGLSRFTYEVQVDGKTVNSGEGQVTTQFENLDY